MPAKLIATDPVPVSLVMRKHLFCCQSHHSLLVTYMSPNETLFKGYLTLPIIITNLLNGVLLCLTKKVSEKHESPETRGLFATCRKLKLLNDFFRKKNPDIKV